MAQVGEAANTLRAAVEKSVAVHDALKAAAQEHAEQSAQETTATVPDGAQGGHDGRTA